MAEERKRIGRPAAVPVARKRHSLGLKVTADIKARIDVAASKSGRTQSQEAEARLQRSFDREDDLRETWGADVFAIAESAARSLWLIEREAGKRWVEDDEAFELFTRTVTELIRNYRDVVVRNERRDLGPGAEPKTLQERAERFADLGGISPPYKRQRSPGEHAADRAASLRGYHTMMAGGDDTAAAASRAIWDTVIARMSKRGKR